MYVKVYPCGKLLSLKSLLVISNVVSVAHFYSIKPYNTSQFGKKNA